MIDSKDFGQMRKEMQDFDTKREGTIRLSRDIIKLSKRAIYSVHRDEMAEAEKILEEMRQKVGKLQKSGNHEEGHFRTALQEFVEAACFYGIVKKKTLPKKSELGVSTESYLLGLCDLSGEVVRRAINAAIKKDYEESKFLRNFLDSLYGEMLKFDLANGDLRRKFDGIKYDLRKLEDLIFEIGKR